MHTLPTIQEREASWLLENLILREKGEPTYLYASRVTAAQLPRRQGPREALAIGIPPRIARPRLNAIEGKTQRLKGIYDC